MSQDGLKSVIIEAAWQGGIEAAKGEAVRGAALLTISQPLVGDLRHFS